MKFNDKLAIALLVILLMITSAVTLFAVNDPLAYRTAELHPQYSASKMQVGGDAGDRDAQYWWIGWIVGSLLLTFLSGLLWFSFSRSATAEDAGPGGGLRLLMASITLLLLAVFAIGCLAYRDFGQTGQPHVQSLAPTATKTLIFGVWLVPLLFAVVYTVGFDSWFLPSESVSDRVGADDSEPKDLERHR